MFYFITKLYLKNLERKGFCHGVNFNLEKGANIDANFCHLISVGNDVTLAKDVYILAHDASMKKYIGKTKIGKVKLGNKVFIGASSVILPGISIGDNCIIGAGSCVTKNIPAGEVWGGAPAKFIMKTEDFLKKQKWQMKNSNSEINYVD